MRWSSAQDPLGRRALTASVDQTARLWDVASGGQLQVLSGHAGQVTAAALGPDLRHAITGGDDGSLLVWDNIDVAINNRIDLAFRTTIFPGYPGVYWNNVIATSPFLEVPDPGDTAPLLTLPSYWRLTPALFSKGRQSMMTSWATRPLGPV